MTLFLRCGTTAAEGEIRVREGLLQRQLRQSMGHLGQGSPNQILIMAG